MRWKPAAAARSWSLNRSKTVSAHVDDLEIPCRLTGEIASLTLAMTQLSIYTCHREEGTDVAIFP
jgi:hypothetical protein